MMFVLLVLAVGLAVAAKRNSRQPLRFFLAAACALNLAGAVHMVATDYPGAYRLQPQHTPEPGDQLAESRPDRR